MVNLRFLFDSGLTLTFAGLESKRRVHIFRLQSDSEREQLEFHRLFESSLIRTNRHSTNSYKRFSVLNSGYYTVGNTPLCAWNRNAGKNKGECFTKNRLLFPYHNTNDKICFKAIDITPAHPTFPTSEKIIQHHPVVLLARRVQTCRQTPPNERSITASITTVIQLHILMNG